MKFTGPPMDYTLLVAEKQSLLSLARLRYQQQPGKPYFLLVQKSAAAALIPAGALALVVVMAPEVKSYTATSGEA